MSTQIDTATGQSLPPDALVRVLFIVNSVHIYNIPPLTSNKGHMAASWTAESSRHIFTARLRILETSYERGGKDVVKVDVLLEDPSSGQLFAAAPYTAVSVVEPVLDSSRFFAVRVQDPSGRKAMLGAGFEGRSEAFDFSIALQDARKGLEFDSEGSGKPAAQKPAPEQPKKDYSLKEGETITINLKGKFGRKLQKPENQPASFSGFSLPPPPPSPAGSSTSLPPPPGPSGPQQNKQIAKDLGFDDGDNNEFA